MQLLFLSNAYPPGHLGGYEELCQDVALGLRRRGHRVTVLTTRGLTDNGDGHEADVIRTLKPEVAIGDPMATLRLVFGRARRRKRNLHELSQALGRAQPDAAVVWGMWNLAPALAADLEAALDSRVLYYVADYWPTLPDAVTQHLGAAPRRRAATPLKAGLALLFSRSQSRLSDGLRLPHVACVSHAVRDTLWAEGITMGRVEVIHNGIDPSQFSPMVGSVPSTPPLRLLLAGRLTHDKGVFVALEALAIAVGAGHDLHLTLAGEGSAAVGREVRSAIHGFGVERHAHMSGRMPRHAMPAIMTRHHVLLVPSLWADPLPRSAQEGMASGLAVVASRIGGLPELIDDGATGLLVPPGDPRSLAEAMGRLAADPALRQRLGEAGLSRVREEFDIQRTVQRIETRLQRMLSD